MAALGLAAGDSALPWSKPSWSTVRQAVSKPIAGSIVAQVSRTTS
jgi:hypothetical protein